MLKWSFLSKLLTTLNRKLFSQKSTILDVSGYEFALTTINQIILTNNKTAISRFFETIALTTLTRFYLIKKSTIETLKTLEQDVKCVWS